jgi:hypothetical protein
MQSIEPIIRLAIHQLTEILPLEVEAAGPPQSDDATNLYLPPAKQIKNSFRSVEQNKFPAVIVSPVSSEPVNPEELLDENDADCVVFRHEFEVKLALTDSESNTEDLTNKLSRYCQIIKRVVRDFEQSALVAAFEASQLDPVDVQIVPGAVFYEEPADKSILLRTAVIKFVAYA